MSERSDLLSSIATTIKDYRAGEINEPTPDHVDRWVSQFSSTIQVPLLREMDYTLKRTYLSKSFVSGFLVREINNKKLAGATPCDYWKNTTLLNIQRNGHSQEEMLQIFNEMLYSQCGFHIDESGSTNTSFLYLDDVMFSGGRVGSDLSAWLKLSTTPAKAVVNILVIAAHTSAEWYLLNKKLKTAAAECKKSIQFHCWAAVRYENQRFHRDISEVLWPAVLPTDAALQAYMAEEKRFPFEPRQVGGKLSHNIFSSEEGRQLLENELLLSGMRIRSLCKNPNAVMRPLGFSGFGLGFGSMIATFRNCPNNCPLALWWGDPEATSGPFHWYPLLPRKTYAQTATFDDFEF